MTKKILKTGDDKCPLLRFPKIVLEVHAQELQILLLKNALLLGVDFRMGMSYEDQILSLPMLPLHYLYTASRSPYISLHYTPVSRISSAALSRERVAESRAGR